jgi:6-pyruvoyltetrahydropterin/6-carboxytetrahydropterin synthase
MRLMREVRCSPGVWPDGPEPGGSGPSEARRSSSARACNSWAGSTDGDLRTFWVLRATVEGPVHEETGFLCNIKQLDTVLLDTVVPHVHDAVARAPRQIAAMGSALRGAFATAGGRCPAPASLCALELKLSPFTSLRIEDGGSPMVRLTRSFEFSAAHRLHRADFSDEENLRVFGKCSNPMWHGHNYVLDVTVEGEPDDLQGTLVEPPQFDRIVQERVITSFDHKNLNAECDEFSALNPSVENIARAIWNRLDGAFPRCKLLSVRVWETPKTYAECTGDDPSAGDEPRP